MKVMNIHTKEVFVVIKKETVKNYPYDFVVYTLSDGNRWNKEQLWKHHVIVNDEENNE